MRKVRCTWLEEDDRGGETAVRAAAEGLITKGLATIANTQTAHKI